MTTRRTLLTAAAALPLAAPAILRATGARAQGDDAPATGPLAHRTRPFAIGGLTVTPLLSGAAVRDDPHSIFGLNVDDATFEEVSAEARIPADAAQFFFTPTLVEDGTNVILFDTGLDPTGMTAALEAAGRAPGDVTHVAITHMHPDHIGGLSQDGTPTFENAEHLAGATEMAAWEEDPSDAFTAKVLPIRDRFTLIEPGAAVGPAEAVEAFGHTPGHMAFRVADGDAAMLLIADTANHPIWSLEHPDWEVLFDMDKAAAAATRRELLGMAAADGTPILGYHMPFPAVGYVEEAGDGFRWIPHSYQLFL
ncbi:glyoxylase-like metal-dependent hydrolase (beta-lactamase superfamily II) [Hasllibacter halocynthiae]|uniref:Glyoxylase-like metal-dependent hydrolase (Beta-lactamase superfamily II) n=1 Tax=Hasllibacter halocynthiae TaxID=595589 RepID=A0A2T0X8H9_9RHOB|nr:MBL fold metallo-hydrolase [Hasllibacter halocynthiae]PRY95227.1 glyoxylase-like metal-dependent hydrolase (beta-lactamase superfamily II) [Hasllibacter halocynthiae]